MFPGTIASGWREVGLSVHEIHYRLEPATSADREWLDRLRSEKAHRLCRRVGFEETGRSDTPVCMRCRTT